MIDEEVEEHAEDQQVLTNDELEELVKSPTEEEKDEETEAEPAMWTLSKSAEVFPV